MAERKNQNEIHPNLINRVLPNNLEAEKAVLGCTLIDEYASVYIMGELNADDFYSPVHKVLFDAMKNIVAKDKPVDIVMLVSELETMGMTEKAGGLSYITSLSNIVPSASNYMHYTDIVKKNSLLRKLIYSAQKITDKAFTGDAEDNALGFAEAEIYSLSQSLDRSSLLPVKPAIDEAIAKMEFLRNNPGEGRGIPTGFRALDKLLNGFQPSDLILIAARPGQGKTSIGMNFIVHAALSNNRRTAAGKSDPFKCAVFSLEMPAVQLAKRIVCSVAKVNMAHANSGVDLTSEEFARIYNARTLLDRSHIYIDDSSLTNPVEILSKCRRLKREKGLDMIMIDYLQLMSSAKRTENRQQEISEITRTLKIAAKELNVPILLLSQMSREVEKRSDKKPQMSDLRESGAIEQDADIVMFIYRKHDARDESIDESTRNMVQLVVAKHRNGETGDIDMRWRGEFVSFEDVDKSAYLAKSMPPVQSEGSFTISNDFSVNENADDNIKEVSSFSTEQLLKVKVDDNNDIF